ncbi:hypothetical protein [Actinoplanes sp. NPDC026619]|uniref:hypothetical protein n=1 Tax=Actinoplanes sp. NPDC026619 TaxID=3155798 RepID=UPI0033C950DC
MPRPVAPTCAAIAATTNNGPIHIHQRPRTGWGPKTVRSQPTRQVKTSSPMAPIAIGNTRAARMLPGSARTLSPSIRSPSASPINCPTAR